MVCWRYLVNNKYQLPKVKMFRLKTLLDQQPKAKQPQDYSRDFFSILLKLEKPEPYLSERIITVFEQTFDLSLNPMSTNHQEENDKEDHSFHIAHKSQSYKVSSNLLINNGNINIDDQRESLDQSSNSMLEKFQVGFNQNQKEQINSNAKYGTGKIHRDSPLRQINRSELRIEDQSFIQLNKIVVNANQPADQIGANAFSPLRQARIANNLTMGAGSNFVEQLGLVSSFKRAKQRLITSQNLLLILNLFEYLEKTRFVADENLLLLALHLVSILPSFEFKLCGDSASAKSCFEVKLYASVDRVLRNKLLPSHFTAKLSEQISQFSGLYEAVVATITSEDLKNKGGLESLELKQLLHLSHLLSNQQQKSIVAALMAKFQNNLKEGLKKDKNRKFIVELISSMLHSSQAFSTQIIQPSQAAEIQALCLKQVNKFLHKSNTPSAIRNMGNQNQNRKLVTFDKIVPYLNLLLNLLVKRQSSDTHLLTEFIIYFFKLAMDRESTAVLLSEEDVKTFIALLLRALEWTETLRRDKVIAFEVLEGLNIFNLVFQKQNQSLFDYVASTGNTSRSILSDESTNLSAHLLSSSSVSMAQVSHNQNGNAPHHAHTHHALLQVNSNIQVLGLSHVFDESILALIRLDLAQEGYHEVSSSVMYLTQLIKYLQAMRKNDESTSSSIRFLLRVLKEISKKTSASETVKQQIQLLSMKIVKSFELIIIQCKKDQELFKIITSMVSVIFIDAQREELTTFILGEFSKLFKKLQLAIYLGPVISILSKQCGNDVKVNLKVLDFIITLLHSHWTDLQLEGVDKQAFTLVLQAVNRVCFKIEMHKGSNSGAQQVQYSQYLQLWLVIIGFMGKHIIKKEQLGSELIQLAQFTPYLTYQTELALMFRLGANKEIYEQFIDHMFSQFPHLKKSPASRREVPTKKQAKQQPLQPIEMPEEDDLETEQEEVSSGDKLFLSLFAFIQELRIDCLSVRQDSVDSIPFPPAVKEIGNFLESLLMIYVNDKIDSELFLFKLENLNSRLFELYITILKKLDCDKRKNETVTSDFCFILKSSCHLQERLRSKAKNYVQNYVESFPYILTSQRIFTTFMDILTALNSETSTLYDSLTHPLRLICSGEQILLPVETEKKIQLLADLQNTFVELVIYGLIIAPDELFLNLEHYKFTISQESKSFNLKDYQEVDGNQNYSVLLFEHLRTSIDFSKVENQNFHSLRKLALTKPWQFIKTVEEMKRQNAGMLSGGSQAAGIQGLQSGIFSVLKKQQNSQIDRILTTKPFSGQELRATHSGLAQTLQHYQIELNAKLKQAQSLVVAQESQQPQSQAGSNHQSRTLQSRISTAFSSLLVQAQGSYPLHSASRGGQEVSFKAYHAVYKQLELKLLQICMKLDIYYSVQRLLKFHTKEVVLQILKKQNEYLNQKVQQERQRLASQPQALQGESSSLYRLTLTHFESNMFSSNPLGMNKEINSAFNQAVFQGAKPSDFSQFHQAAIPLILKDNQKINQSVQKLVHQVNRKRYLTKLSAKLQHHLGLMAELLKQTSLDSRSKNFTAKGAKCESELGSLQNQALSLILSMPLMIMCKESAKALNGCLATLSSWLQSDAHLLSKHFQIMNLGLSIAMTKIQKQATMYQEDRVIKQFTLKNKMKHNLQQVAWTYTSVDYLESLVSKYGYIQAITSKAQLNDDMYLKLKLQSNFCQDQNSKQVLKFLDAYLDQLINQLPILVTKSAQCLGKLAQLVTLIIGDEGEQKWFRKASTEKPFIKASLKVIKLGFMIVDYARTKQLSFSNQGEGSKDEALEIVVDRDFQQRVYHFLTSVLSVPHFHSIVSNLQDAKEEIQHIEDIKFLVEQDGSSTMLPHQASQFQLFQESLALDFEERGKFLPVGVLYDATHRQQMHKRLLRHGLVPQTTQKYQLNSLRTQGSQIIKIESEKQLSEFQLLKKNQSLDLKLYSKMALYLIAQIKSNLLGWNYNEKMLRVTLTPSIDIQFLQEKVYSLVKQMPKLITQIFFKVGTSQKVQDLIKPHLTDDIIKRPSLYFWSNDALQLYLEEHLKNKKLKETKAKASMWRCWDVVKQLKYLGFKFNSEYYLNQLGLKPLEYVESKVILLYLSEIYQSLRNDCQQQIQKFLIKKSRQYASVAHNVLWFCKVESEPDKAKGRKVALPLRENLPEVTQLLEKNILVTMTHVQTEFFKTETDFFEMVTSISGLLQPKFPKDQKKAIIREKLVEYNKLIPESVYLPTNPNCKVVGIIASSGAPMQSAARVPILVSFEVVDYPGPDNDPVLQQISQDTSGGSSHHSPSFGRSLNQTQGASRNQGLKQERSRGGSLGLSPRSKAALLGQHLYARSLSQAKKKSTVLASKRKTQRNAEVRRSALMKFESVVMDDLQQKQYLREIEDSDSEEMSEEDDDPNTSPRNQANLPNQSYVRDKLQQYKFVHNKNQDKFNSVTLPSANNTLNSASGRQVLQDSQELGSALSLAKQQQSVPLPEEFKQQQRDQLNGSSSSGRDQDKQNRQQQNEEDKAQDKFSISDDQNSSTGKPYGSQQQPFEKFTFRGGAAGSAQQASNTSQADQNQSWSALQNRAVFRDTKYSTMFNESPDKISLLSQKRYDYEPIVDVNAVSMTGRDGSLQFMKSYEQKFRRNTASRLRNSKLKSPGGAQQKQDHRNVKVVSCIFKVNDDLRQDILALQVIKLFQKIFKKHELDLFVAPYKCISNRTGDERLLGGIVECVPFSNSRDQLGKAFEIDLYQYFLKKYGSESSTEFKVARLNFIKSLSAYSVVSYILQIKDRHNGNILMDDFGHLIHIDFGFIFDWSPGKDMGFESANFKLTKEFIAILGGHQQAEAYQLYVTKTVQAFLAVREHAREFRNLVALMIYSGFPCFKEHSLQKLEDRFRLDLNTLEAANHMRLLIQSAHDKWTTNFYDKIQYLQNKIVY